MKPLQTVAAAVLLLSVVAFAPVGIGAQTATAPVEWRYFGGDKGFSRYAPLDQINRQNVINLRIAWRRSAIDPAWKQAFPDLRVSGNLRSTPIIVNGVLYAPNALGFVRAMDPETGQTMWEQRPFAASIEEFTGQSPRGVDYWRSPSGTDERLYIARGEYLYAVNLKEGGLYRDFGDQGRVTLHWNVPLAGRFNWTAGPIIAGDVVVVAGNTGGAGDGGVIKEATPEDVRGYDVGTGKLLWTFSVVAGNRDEGNASWGKESWKYSGDLGSWCCVTADEELGLVFIPLSAPTSASYGGHRPGDNLYSNTLVAIDAKTGKKVWHFQMVHHDLWEYDTVGPATLGDITVNGRRIKAVMQPSKTGFLYVFDRKTGEPVWPIVERPVPQSTVPGEMTSPTQPFPTKPPAFDRQGFSEDDLIDFTPELRSRAREAVKHFVMGPLFTPPSLRSEEPGATRGTLTIPGGWGAGNWHTGAFDPETGVYYAVSHTQPGVRGAVKTTDPNATMDYAGQARGQQVSPQGETPTTPPPEQQQNPNTQGPWPGPQLSLDGFPIFKPPYGRITALDMNRGELLWMVANGDGPRHHPLVKDLNLPPLGIPGRAAPLLTRSLLFIGEGSDSIPGTNREGMWGKKFRAYDKGTGKVLWETELPAGTTGAPMTYTHRGKQYIVVAVGGREYPAEWIAFALP
ncbi:MAG: PQQ-binding-like beta-propeller repeat protein [Vicinamibacterales bacterium]